MNHELILLRIQRDIHTFSCFITYKLKINFFIETYLIAYLNEDTITKQKQKQILDDHFNHHMRDIAYIPKEQF